MPYGLQNLLSRGSWDHDWVRDDLRGVDPTFPLILEKSGLDSDISGTWTPISPRSTGVEGKNGGGGEVGAGEPVRVPACPMTPTRVT